MEQIMSKLSSVLGVSVALVVAAGCGGGQKADTAGGDTAAAPADAWSDWQSYNKVSKDKWVSPTHGKRFVEIYVNDVGFEAYKGNQAMPVGSIVVKPSWENTDGKPGADGPLFVMIKKEAGYAPDNGDWYYAFEWAEPQGKWAGKGALKWTSPSDKVEYCLDCHDTEGDHQLGGVPAEYRNW